MALLLVLPLVWAQMVVSVRNSQRWQGWEGCSSRMEQAVDS